MNVAVTRAVPMAAALTWSMATPVCVFLAGKEPTVRSVSECDFVCKAVDGNTKNFRITIVGTYNTVVTP